VGGGGVLEEAWEIWEAKVLFIWSFASFLSNLFFLTIHESTTLLQSLFCVDVPQSLLYYPLYHRLLLRLLY